MKVPPTTPREQVGSSRSYFALLTLRELGDLSQSSRTRVLFILIAFLITISAVFASIRLREEKAAPDKLLEDYEKALEGATVGKLADILHPAAKPYWKLAFLSEGQQHRTPDVYRQALSPWYKPRLENRHPTNDRLYEVESLDWIYLIGTVFSLGAFLLGYDAVCGRRQRRVMEMVLAQSVERSKLLLAKWLAICVCLASPFLLGAFLSLAILILYGGLEIEFVDGIKILMVTLLGLWAIAFFVLTALLISTLSREGHRCLIALALIWVAAKVVIPTASGLMTQMMRPLPSEQEISRQLEDIRQEIVFADGASNDWRPPEWARSDDYDLERRSAKTQYRWHELQETYRKSLLEKQFSQIAMARKLSWISPIELIQDIAERLIGSGLYRDEHFVEQARAFKEMIANHVRKADLEDPESPNLFFFSRYLSNRDAQIEAVPRFEFLEISIDEGFERSIPPLLILLILSLAILIATYLSFARFQVR